MIYLIVFLDQPLLKGFWFYVMPIRYKCVLCIPLKSTDLGSLIGNTQCGNVGILLQLRFFPENSFSHFEAPKTAILTI